MWFECAPGSTIVDGHVVQATPPTIEELSNWFSRYLFSNELQNQVWHRFVLTRGRSHDLHKWAAHQFFFRNATKSQLSLLRCPA